MTTRKMVVSACPLCKKALSVTTFRKESQAGSRHTPTPALFPSQQTDQRRVKCSKQPFQRSSHTLSARCSYSCHADTEAVQQPVTGVEAGSTPRWDVIGLGQPMVDFSASVEDDLLVRLGIVKGSRR